MKAIPQTDENENCISLSSTVELLFHDAKNATYSPVKERLLLRFASNLFVYLLLLFFYLNLTIYADLF